MKLAAWFIAALDVRLIVELHVEVKSATPALFIGVNMEGSNIDLGMAPRQKFPKSFSLKATIKIHDQFPELRGWW